MNINKLHQLFLKSTGICTDTRSLQTGQLFFALKGENFNGNAFAKAALDQGASYAIIDEVAYNTTPKTILVANALKCLQDLATYHRRFLKIPIIALTGSNGKTTTKELITAVLSQQYVVNSTIGNLNNHIGVPLTLLKMNDTTEVGVVEMGANHKGEIQLLCEIAQPDYGYITNFGKAHLEGFGGIEGVIKGKSELYNYLRKKNDIVFVNYDDEIQMRQTEGMQRYTFGSEASDCPIPFLKADPNVTVIYNSVRIESHLIGNYNAPNIAAAITIGSYFKLSIAQIQNGIQNYTPDNNRSQIINRDQDRIILDAYNANPSSMQVALQNLKLQKSEHHIAFLGDMFEVGEHSLSEHLAISQMAIDLKIDQIHLIGHHFNNIKQDSATVYQYEDFETFIQQFKGLTTTKNTILIKGSRGMAMERILGLL